MTDIAPPHDDIADYAEFVTQLIEVIRTRDGDFIV